VFGVWQGDGDRDVETQLVQQLDFDKFDLIKELLKNRLKIVWCTRLQRAQAEDEKARIEVLLCPPFMRHHMR
jgi:pre-mRNA-splicing helicase BRR2